MFCIDFAVFQRMIIYIYLSKLLVKLPTEVIVKYFLAIHCTDKEGLLNFKNIEVIYWLDC